MRWMGAFADVDWRGRLVCLVKGCCGEWTGPKAPSSSCGERSQCWRARSNWECKVFFFTWQHRFNRRTAIGAVNDD